MSIEEGRITSRATPTSKGEKTRYIRPVERQRMRPWLIEHLEQDDVPGLTWQTRNQGIFRISWKHAANQCFHMQNDTNLFERWAIHTGRHDDSDHKRWKANFRCALNSLPDVMELKDHGVKKGSNAFKVYKFLDEKETKANRETKALAKIKKEVTFTGVPTRHAYLGNVKSSESGDETSSAVGGIPNLSCLVPASDEMLVDAGGDDDAGSLDHLQEILTAATASLAEGIDASALEQISIEQLSRMGEVSKMKLDIRDSEQSEPSEPMYVYLCSWCQQVYPDRVELFQHFLVQHQEELLARDEYHQEGSSLQREIEDLEKKVFNFTREKFKSKDTGEVIEDGQVVDISTTHIMTSQDVYIEDQALDLTVTQAQVPTTIRQEVALDLSSGITGKKHKFIVTASPIKGHVKVIAKKRRSGALDMDYIKKFDDFGMAGKPRTKRQLSLVTKKKEEKEKIKEEKEKMKKSEGGKKDVDPATQHSMEDIAHAEILISLKSAANEDEETDDAEEDAADTDEDSEKEGKVQASKGVKRARADDDEEEDNDDEDEEDDAAKAFKCGICSNTFSDAATLYAHVTEHKNEYKCGICNEVYNNKDDYVQHLVTHVPSAELIHDANKCPPIEHKCNFCEKSYPTAKKLEKHKTEHYTIIAMKTKGDKVAMVVHPKQSKEEAETRVALVHPKQANEKEETETKSEKELESKKPKSVPVDGNQDVYIVYSAEGGDKVCEVVTSPNETSSEHEEMEVEKAADTDSVDGMQGKMELSEAGSKEVNEGTDEEIVKEEKSQVKIADNAGKGGQDGESQLPAFSEIVKDVDEFFIKETKPQSNGDVREKTFGKGGEDKIVSGGEEDRNVVENMEIVIAPSISREETVEEIVEYEFKCVICEEEHDTQQKLNEHMKLHSIFELANAKGSIEGKEKPNAEGEKKSKVFICKLCGSNFSQFTDLKKHVASHLEKSKKREVKEGSLKETVPRAKRGRPPIRKVPGMKDVGETGHAAGSKQKVKSVPTVSVKPPASGTSILAAALKKGPKFQLSPALFEKTKGAVEKVDETGDAKPEPSELKKKLEAPPKSAIVPDTSEPKKEPLAETKPSNITELVITEFVNEKDEAKPNDSKEQTEDESFASKLLVQGVTSYLQNKDGTITTQEQKVEQKVEPVTATLATKPAPAVVTSNISNVAAMKPETKPLPAANIPVVSTAVISNIVNMGNITTLGNQAVNIAGKVAPHPLGPVRIMTASDIKNAAPQQVIFLKQGTPLPVQLASQLSALQQSVMTTPQMSTLQHVSLPVTHLGGLQHTAISIPQLTQAQLTQAQQTAISIAQQTTVPTTILQSTVPKTTNVSLPVYTQPKYFPGIHAPTVKQMISAQKSAAMKKGQDHKTPTVLPVSFVKTLSTATGTPVVLPVTAYQKVTAVQSIPSNITIANMAAVSSTPKPAVTIPPKITIPLSALQVLPAASMVTTETPASTAVNPVIVEQIESTSKVNPQVQSNLLNMVLARMGQSGSNVSVIATASSSLAASISSTGPTITAVSSEAFKTPVSGKSLLTSSVLASPEGKATGQFTKEELLQQAKSLQLKDGLFLFCSRCKQALTSLEEMSAHVCSANKTSGQTPSPLSGINVPTASSEPAQKVMKTLTTDDVAAARNSAPITSEITGTTVAVNQLLSSQHSNVVYGKNVRCQNCVGDPVAVGFHQLITHNSECRICYARLKKVEVYQHANNHCMSVMRNCIQCLTCKDIFVAMDLYNDHKDHCDKNAEYTTVNHQLVKCQGCSLHLKSTNIVLWHVKKSHIQRVWYSCSVCDKTFQFWKDVKSSIMEHMQLENAGNPPDISFCHFCNLVFKNNTDRLAHEKTPVHSKNYYMRVKSLGTVIVSGNSQGIVFPIPVETTNISDEHFRTADKPEATNEVVDYHCCRECSLRFKSLFQLRQHRVIRHGEVMKGRPKHSPIVYTCDACRATFVVPYRLKKHKELCPKYIQSKLGGVSTNNKQPGVKVETGTGQIDPSETVAMETNDDVDRVETQDIENS